MLRLRGVRWVPSRCCSLHTSAVAYPRHSSNAFRIEILDPVPSSDTSSRLASPRSPNNQAAKRLAWRKSNLSIDKDILVKVAGLLADRKLDEALTRAQSHLTALRDFEVPLSTRAATYHAFIMLFLRDSHGATASRSLLLRQIAERVPLTSQEAIKAIHALRGHIPPLREFAELLPGSFSPNLLAEIMHVVVRQARPPPHQVRSLIKSVMDAYNRERGIDTKAAQPPWPLPLRLVVLESHLAYDDWRGAIKALGFMIQAAKVDKEKDPNWVTGGAKAVTVAYTSILGAWVRQATSGSSLQRAERLGSKIPYQTARSLVDLLTPANCSETQPQYQLLPGHFLNAWMNAERVASQSGHAEMIWYVISGQTVDDTIAGIKPPKAIKAESWQVLFRYLKTRPPESYRPLADLLLSNPVDGHTLNALLSSVVAVPKPDLPLVLRLIPFTPNARTVDLVASALIRTARCGHYPSKQPVFPRDGTDSGVGISMAEWEWASEVLTRTARYDKAHSAAGQHAESSAMAQLKAKLLDVKLPVSRSRASYLPLQPNARGEETVRMEYAPPTVENLKDITRVLKIAIQKCVGSDIIDRADTLARETAETGESDSREEDHQQQLRESIEDDFDPISDQRSSRSRKQPAEARKRKWEARALRLKAHVDTVEAEGVKLERLNQLEERRRASAERREKELLAIKEEKKAKKDRARHSTTIEEQGGTQEGGNVWSPIRPGRSAEKIEMERLLRSALTPKP